MFTSLVLARMYLTPYWWDLGGVGRGGESRGENGLTGTEINCNKTLYMYSVERIFYGETLNVSFVHTCI